MDENKIISGTSEEEIWAQVVSDITSNELLEYSIIIDQNGIKILLNIDIDLGGGFESGYELTTLSGEIANSKDFRFAIHHESFIDEIGKFLGMQDVEIGYSQFDKQLIVKTNNEIRVRKIFADADVRQAFERLDNFTFGITHHHVENSDAAFLELKIERGITDPAELRTFYRAFYKVLTAIVETGTLY